MVLVSRLKLISLRLENFMGVREDTLQMDGASATLRGTNATGKTTRFSAFTWLLFGKDALDRAVFDLKRLEDGKAVHNLEHTVEGVFDLDGRRLVLRKTQVETWERKRGQADREFTGHEVHHFIDGVPVLKREYDARVAEIAPEGQFRLLTDPAAFNAMHWEKRRAILLEICGDISDDQVIAGNPELADLPAFLDGRTHDQHRKFVGSRRAELNKELAALPVRIDEATKALPDVDPTLRPAFETKLKGLRDQRGELEQRRAQVEAGGAVAELMVQIRTDEAALAGVVQRVRSAAEADLAAARRARDTANDALNQARRDVDRLRTDISTAERATANGEAEITRLRDQWAEIDAETAPHSSVPSTCAACGQSLPADKVTAAQERALALWNTDRSQRLEANQSKGMQLSDGVKELAAKLERLRTDLSAAEQRQASAEAASLEASTTADTLTASLPDPELDQEHVAITARIADLRTQAAAAKANTTEAATGIRREIDTIDVQIKAVEAELATYVLAERTHARLAELDALQKAAAAEFESLELQLHLLDLFLQEKSALLTKHINSRFRITEWRLFGTNINKGLEPDCTATVGGVPYNSGLNEAGRINCGLDIIRVLQAHHGFYPPVWIDGAESVVDTLELHTQVIQLVVDGTRPTLTLELQDQALEAVA